MEIIEKRMKEIAIFGAGGFGKEVACMINLINKEKPTWNLIGFFDDNPKYKGEMISHYGEVLGGMEELNCWERPLSVVIAVGNPLIVKKIVMNITNTKLEFPNLWHPRSYVNDPMTFSIGKGNIIQSDCSFSCDVHIGDFNVFNGAVVFGHDDSVGSYNSLMPNIRISGEVTIGDCNFFGVGSTILQQIKIGNEIRLGAGSVLMRNAKSGLLYMGNPAKIIKL